MSFFFQAEDGIRDSSVTGVQTCALPISIDQGGDEASQTECSGQADADADECYAHALAEDHTKNVGGRSAKCDADANFVGALAGEVGDYPVDSYGGKRQRER